MLVTIETVLVTIETVTQQLDGTVRGDLNAASRWRATKKTWFYNFVFDGRVTVRASGYRITSRVVLGKHSYNALLISILNCARVSNQSNCISNHGNRVSNQHKYP